MSVSAVGSGNGYQYYTRPTGPPPAAEMQTAFEAMDGDGDGGLSIEESGLDQEKFALMDIDGDGKLTEADREAAMAQMQATMQGQGGQGGRGVDGPGRPPDPSQMIQDLDTDGDEALSEVESGMDSEMFSSLDTDGDGVVTLAELQAAANLRQPSGDEMPPPPPESSSFMGSYGLSAYQDQSNLFSSGQWAGQTSGGLSLTA